jgi:hypothetical protein
LPPGVVLGYQNNFKNESTDFAVANGLDSGRFGINLSAKCNVN